MTVEERSGAVRALHPRRLRGAVDMFDPDIVVVDAPELPGSQTYRGRAAVAEALRELHEMFDGPTVDIQDLRIGPIERSRCCACTVAGRAAACPSTPTSPTSSSCTTTRSSRCASSSTTQPRWPRPAFSPSNRRGGPGARSMRRRRSRPGPAWPAPSPGARGCGRTPRRVAAGRRRAGAPPPRGSGAR